MSHRTRSTRLPRFGNLFRKHRFLHPVTEEFKPSGWRVDPVGLTFEEQNHPYSPDEALVMRFKQAELPHGIICERAQSQLGHAGFSCEVEKDVDRFPIDHPFWETFCYRKCLPFTEIRIIRAERDGKRGTKLRMTVVVMQNIAVGATLSFLGSRFETHKVLV